ncbi:hypothetical protein BH10ACI4_BH10ACI4_35960 [soil metagenome]
MTKPLPATNPRTSPSPQQNAVLGSGEMAGLIRNFDWSSTPVGPIESWSKELLSILNVMLASPVSALIYWGESFCLFYNDAARPFASDKHPASLGCSARSVWREAWHIIGPEVESVLMSGESVSRNEELVPLEQEGQLKDMYWNYSYSPIFEDGAVRGVLVLCQEVTEAVMAHQNVRVIATKLEQVLEATTDAVVLLDRDWRFTYVNKRGQEILQSSGDLTGKIAWEAFPAMIYPDSPFVFHYHRAMYEGRQGEFVAEYPAPLNLTIQIMVHPSSAGIIIFFRDITQQKLRESALVRTEKLAAVGRMASSIAHEINNPLEAVTNLLYLARQTEGLPEVHSYLDVADSELRRVGNIVNQTLRFHRQASKPQSVSCVDLFSTVLSMYESRLRNFGIVVEKRKRANKPAEIYEGDIRQVLNNLVGNALDAMPRGGRLLVRSREATDWRSGSKGLVLTVADSGSGMDAETQAHIFEAFFTTKGIGGTGLGLWVSAEIVERHGGRIIIRSSQRKGRSGTVATLFLPFDSQPRTTNTLGPPILPA